MVRPFLRVGLASVHKESVRHADALRTSGELAARWSIPGSLGCIASCKSGTVCEAELPSRPRTRCLRHTAFVLLVKPVLLLFVECWRPCRRAGHLCSLFRLDCTAAKQFTTADCFTGGAAKFDARGPVCRRTYRAAAGRPRCSCGQYCPVPCFLAYCSGGLWRTSRPAQSR